MLAVDDAVNSWSVATTVICPYNPVKSNVSCVVPSDPVYTVKLSVVLNVSVILMLTKVFSGIASVSILT